MSFGFSIGDFVALSSLALKLYRDFKGAPGEFAQISRDLQSSHILIADLVDQASNQTSPLNRYAANRRAELIQLRDNIDETLKKLSDLHGRYSKMGRVSWLRFGLGQNALVPLRSELILHISAINSFVGSLNMGAFGRLEPMMERICVLLNERAKGNLNMAQTVLSASKDEDDGASWAMLELDLKTEGVPPEYIEGNVDRIKEVLTTVCEINHLDGLDTGTIHPDESVSQIGDRGDNEDEERTIVNAPSKMKRPPARRSRDISYQDWLRNLSPEQNAARISLMNRTGIDIKDFRFELGKNSESVGSRKQGRKALWPILKKMPMKYSKGDIMKEYTWSSTEAVTWACKNGEKEILSLLLEAGCNHYPYVSDNPGFQPIIYAAVGGHWTLVDLLIHYGADSRDSWCNWSIPIENGYRGFRLIHFAAYQNQLELIRRLLDRGNPVDDQASGPDGTPIRLGYTPLLCAAMTGSYAAAKLLVENGAYVNFPLEAVENFPSEMHGYYPLHFAVEKKDVKFAKLLLESGARVNTYTTAHESPLDIAIRAEDFDIAKLLLDFGAWVNASNRNGHTPLYSLYSKHEEPFRGTLTKESQDTTWIYSYRPNDELAKKIYPLVKLLLDKGADIDPIMKPWIEILRSSIGLEQANSQREQHISSTDST
jgi:ankyrin repeat protein